LLLAGTLQAHQSAQADDKLAAWEEERRVSKCVQIAADPPHLHARPTSVSCRLWSAAARCAH
jgi:hypothetical protein